MKTIFLSLVSVLLLGALPSAAQMHDQRRHDSMMMADTAMKRMMIDRMVADSSTRTMMMNSMMMHARNDTAAMMSMCMAMKSDERMRQTMSMMVCDRMSPKAEPKKTTVKKSTKTRKPSVPKTATDPHAGHH